MKTKNSIVVWLVFDVLLVLVAVLVVGIRVGFQGKPLFSACHIICALVTFFGAFFFFVMRDTHDMPTTE